MSTELAKQQEQAEIIKQKRAAWADLGEVIYTAQIGLQAIAQQSIAKLKTPTTIEDVPEAEDALKTVKSELKQLQEKRMDYTSRLEAVKSNLMLPEKSFEDPIAKSTNAIIEVKKEEEKKKKKLAEIETEARTIKETILRQLEGWKAEIKTRSSSVVTNAFTHALATNVTIEGLTDYLFKIKTATNSITLSNAVFSYKLPTLLHHDLEAVKAIESQITIPDPVEIVKEFTDALEKQFSDYAIALQNKETATKKAEEEAKQKQAEIKDQAETQIIANKMEAQAETMPISFGFEIKPLKKSFEIDMEETFPNAFLILSAALANWDLVKSKTTVKKPFEFSASNAGKALAKVKSDDNNFAPQGIVFKEVDKL